MFETIGNLKVTKLVLVDGPVAISLHILAHHVKIKLLNINLDALEEKLVGILVIF